MKRRTAIVLTASLTAMVVTGVLLWAFRNVLAAPPNAPAASTTHQLPDAISYQGRLTNPDTGDPVADGTYDMTFSLYDVVTETTPDWTMTRAVSVTDGLFQVELRPLGPEDFTGGPRWLGVQVGSDPEMRPRQRLLSVPYAFRAETLRVGGQVTGTLAGAPLYQFINGGTGPALWAENGGAAPALVAKSAGGLAVSVAGGALIGGDLHIGSHSPDNLTWYTRTSYISVSPAAFQPVSETQSYVKTGRYLYSSGGPAEFSAPLQLPHGATVTEMQFSYYHDAASPPGVNVVTMTLRRRSVAGVALQDMAQVVSQDAPGPRHLGSGNDDSIDYAVVDNERYIYWLQAAFDDFMVDDSRKVRAVVIEYQYTEPY